MGDKNQIEESHANKVVSGTGGEIKKPSTLRKLAKIFFTDNPEQTAKNLVTQVVEPLVRRSIVDAVATFVVGHPIYGNSPINVGNWSITPPSGSGTPYWQFGNNSNTTPPSSALMSQPVTGGAKFNGMVFFKDYQTAFDVLEELNRILREYHRVRLLELYDAANIPGMEYVTNNWGWTDLTGAQIYPSGDGYILQLPPVRQLN